MVEDILLPYQKAWIADTSPVKVWEKSRRIGASYVEALDSAMWASRSKEAGGQNTYYLSYNKEMTQQFVEDCAFWAKEINAVASELEEVVLEDEGKDVTVYRIRFASGFDVWGLPSSPRSLRSKQGRVVIDEAAFVEDLAELRKAAMALRMWGGVIRILSTHNGEDNAFNDIIKEVREGKLPFSLHRTTIDNALAEGLYRRICLVKKLPWSLESERSWRDSLFKEYGDGAEEELLCIPSRSGTRYFSRALIETCMKSEIPIRRLSLTDDFTFEREAKREHFMESWFDENVKGILTGLKNFVYAGQDFARSGDLSVIWLLEEEDNLFLDTALVIELRNCPFAQQYQLVKLIIGALKRFGAWAFDARGNGQMIAELAAQEWRGYIHQVMLSQGWYQDNMPKLKARYEDRQTSAPKDSEILDDFRTVGLKNGIPQILEHSGSGKNRRHGDSVVADCLAVFAVNEDAGTGGYQPYKYDAIKEKNPWREGGKDE